MKRILILGGGFAGTAAAIEMRKHKEPLNLHITLINDTNYHLFTPSLYEVATSEEPKKNIAIPLKEIVGEHISVVVGKVKYIHPNLHRVYLENEKYYQYDYLILALGSEPEYFHIPGLKQHSLPLKTLNNAQCIKDAVKDMYHEKIKEHKSLNIIVGGGGFSGTELTAELIGYKKNLITHHHSSEQSINITVIQGSECLLKELDRKVAKIAAMRISQEGANIIYGSHIKHVSSDMVTTDREEKFPYDIVIWTGGVRANSITHASGFSVNHRGQVMVNSYLQVLPYQDIFAAGDIADYLNPLTKSHLPTVAPVAEAQGKMAAVNIYRQIKGLPLLTFHFIHWGYIVPLRGRYCVAQIAKFHIIGPLAWILQQIVFLYYLLSILPLHRAFRRWNTFERDLTC